MIKSLIEKAIINQSLSKFESLFLRRIYNQDLDPYIRRLAEYKNLQNHSLVLDLGSGFGQWSLALSKYNRHIVSLELELPRLKVQDNLVQYLKLKNISLCNSNMLHLPFSDDTFDCIYAYSSIYFEDHTKVLKEMSRILKNQGVIYLNVNSLGWYIKNLFARNRKYGEYNIRLMAFKSILSYFIGKLRIKKLPGSQCILKPKSLVKHLNSLGFDYISISEDGGKSDYKFFKNRYIFFTSVYEVMGVINKC
jgi:SAM-dependent methyltransferase